MGRKKAHKIDFTFLPFPVDVLGSKTWAKLTNAARTAYLHIRERWWFDRQKPVSLTYAVMERFMGRKTFSAALKQLETNGFIEKSQTGGLFRKRNYFDISDEWRRIEREEAEIETNTDWHIYKG
jgi:hypothetical protein